MARVRLVAVGRVGRPHGIRGEVRIEVGDGLSEGLARYSRLYLGRSGRADAADAEPVTIDAWRTHGRFLLVRFEGVQTPDEAARLTSSTLYVERGEMPPLEPDEYYHADLLGCAVRDEAGEWLGSAEDVFATGAHDVLVIRSPDGEWMLPLTAETLVSLNLEASEIQVRVPEGLRG
ncbi:MAG: 16S rRNA processing protein RimM [Deltaproteobacteria bacterium]|nr:16S rRNA processing protein RimM [Deltaproteobacteria bacterium]